MEEVEALVSEFQVLVEAIRVERVFLVVAFVALLTWILCDWICSPSWLV